MSDSVNHEVIFRQSRYGPTGGGDYLNCPMDKNTYELFVSELLKAEKAVYFEG